MSLPQAPPEPMIVGIGEVLFDCFPDKSLLGGAPVNFLIHAAQLLKSIGKEGAVVSRVGDDSLGAKVRLTLDSKGINTTYMQRDEERPTGTVQVTFDSDNQPRYEIVNDVAWDHLHWSPDLERFASQCCVVCFGTLAQRTETARHTIANFLKAADKAVRVCDLNFRPPFVDPAVVEQSLRIAQVVKLSEDELSECSQLLRLTESEGVDTDSLARSLMNSYNVELLAVTRGKRGTVMFTPDQRAEGAEVDYPRQPDADNVGAGDACTAGLVAGLVAGMPLQQIVDLANHCGAYVVTQSGATPELPKEILGMVRPD